MGGLIQIEAEDLGGGDLIIFKEKESAQDVVVCVLLGHSDLLLDLLKHAEVRVCCVLDEAIEEDGHLVSLELVLAHYLEELISTVLKEEDLRLKRISVQELVSNLREGLNHQVKDVSATVSGCLVVLALVLSGDSHHWVCLLEALSKEAN
jgi:hypothetical protein